MTTDLATCSGTGIAQCTPGITIPTATAATDNCGYSITSFNENAFICGLNAMSEGTGPALIQGFFNDEWPLTLGCATTTYPVSPMTTATLGDLMYPQLGDPTCNDVNGRPLRPTLFITDITADPNCKAGDQQSGGVPCPGSGLTGKGYGAEVLYEVALVSGHSYRLANKSAPPLPGEKRCVRQLTIPLSTAWRAPKATAVLA